MTTDTTRFERLVLLLMALVQFINIWDFMIVMPLGPDFARALGIDAGHIGWIAGSYSISAATVSILSARFLDRFDRRSVLLFNLVGLMFSTLSMSLAGTLWQLIVVRMITGMFGGQVVACSLAVIADVFPEHRRGEAIGKVFGSFSVASVVGVPLGLEIAELFGWWSPFAVVSGVALITIITIRMYLPPMRHHIENRNTAETIRLWHSLGRNKAMIPACILIASSMFGLFMIIPNISAVVQENLGYPRHLLGVLYFFGGLAAFFSMRFTGRQSDRIGYARTALYATFVLWFTVYVGFYAQTTLVPVLVMFILFMVASSTRNVTSNALISKIPQPQERAGFMSLMAAIQNLTCGAGSMCATMMLHETADHHLSGMRAVSLISMILFAIMPWMMFRIEKIVSQRQEDGLIEAELNQL